MSEEEDASVASSSDGSSSPNRDDKLSKKFRVLSLRDGIMIEPVPTHEEDDDDDEEEEEGEEEEGLFSRLAVEIDDERAADKCDDLTEGTSRCTRSSYGPHVGPPSELEERIGPDVDGGLVFKFKLLPNDYNKDWSKKEKLKFLHAKDYDPAARAPKPRRKMPFPMTVDDFYSSLTRVGQEAPSLEDQAEDFDDEMWDRERRRSGKEDEEGGGGSQHHGVGVPPRWLFDGIVNGWPGLPMPLDVMAIRARGPGFLGRSKGFAPLWRRDDEGRIGGRDPSTTCRAASEERGLQVKVELRGPAWSAHGWSRRSPGFLFWVEGRRVGAGGGAGGDAAGTSMTTTMTTPPKLTVTYGTDLTDRFRHPEADDPKVTRVHMINHRYATGGKRAENQKDRLTYHSLILLEWDHREYCSVVEIGYLNGLGGYKCKSNWYDDRDEKETGLYAAFPPEMIMPWKDTMSEIRVHDVPYADLDSFLGFMKKYAGHTGRFVDVNVSFSHAVRLTYRSRANIVSYLLNYIRRDCTYSEIKRNCQTFAADLCGFLAGKRNVHPYHPVNQIQYTCQKHKFLYESSGYRR